VPAAPDYAPTLAASGRRRPPQRATLKNSRRGFFGSPSGRTLSRRHLPRRAAPGYRACGYKTASGRPKWLNRDPIGENGGLNLYGYCFNDPVNRLDPLGLSTPVPISVGGQIVGVVNLPITFTPGGRYAAVPTYGNWGGPDYSGGQRPSLNNGQNGSGAPVDSLDALTMTHDLAYGKYGLTPDTPSADCDNQPTPCAQEKCRQKRRADAALYLGLNNLGDDPSKWAKPAADPTEASLYRYGAIQYFGGATKRW
jgi:RHS repeat-associated protein